MKVLTNVIKDSPPSKGELFNGEPSATPVEHPAFVSSETISKTLDASKDCKDLCNLFFIGLPTSVILYFLAQVANGSAESNVDLLRYAVFLFCLQLYGSITQVLPLVTQHFV